MMMMMMMLIMTMMMMLMLQERRAQRSILRVWLIVPNKKSKKKKLTRRRLGKEDNELSDVSSQSAHFYSRSQTDVPPPPFLLLLRSCNQSQSLPLPQSLSQSVYRPLRRLFYPFHGIEFPPFFSIALCFCYVCLFQCRDFAASCSFVHKIPCGHNLLGYISLGCAKRKEVKIET